MPMALATISPPALPKAFQPSFREVTPVMASVMEHFAPEAIVLQCGADSLSGDRLGCFNLSVKGHGDCVRFMKTFNVPMLVIGGGGYTMRNVSRAWTYETSIVLDSPVPNAIPVNDYYPYYGPDFDLCIPASNMENLNTPEYLERVKQQLFEQLRGITPCSVQIQTGQPGTSQTPDTADQDPDGAERDARDDDDADRRESAETLGERVQADTEMYDGDGDQDNGAAGGDLRCRDQPSDVAGVGMGQDVAPKFLLDALLQAVVRGCVLILARDGLAKYRQQGS